jgi:hypothetical protein
MKRFKDVFINPRILGFIISTIFSQINEKNSKDIGIIKKL